MGKEDGVKFSLDEELLGHLINHGMDARRLTGEEHRDWEGGWRGVYGHLIESGSGYLRGGAAVEAYLRERGMEWMVVPFLSGVAGTGIGGKHRVMSAYQCEGPVVELGEFYGAEFFVSPIDLAWTFVVSGGDLGVGGVYFLRG